MSTLPEPDLVAMLREISGFRAAILEQTGKPSTLPCLKAQAADEIERLRAEIERLQADAVRYRWLRDAPATWSPDPMREWMWRRPFGIGDRLDAAIDAAIAASQAEDHTQVTR